MRVVIADRRYTERRPYRKVAEAEGAEFIEGDCQTEDDVIEQCRDADVIILSKSPMSRRVIEQLENARAMIRIGTGFDTVDIKAATDHGIVVANTPGYSTHQISTHALTLMLAAAREVVYSDQDMRAQNGFGERRQIVPTFGKTMGIVGLGRIGRALVPKARGLEMDVIAYDPYVPNDVFEYLDVEKVTFDELLPRADAISVHAPLTAETHQLFSTDEFAAMKDDAIFVNTARGPIVDEQALVDAVEGGSIFAAGLDVFQTEPPVDSPALSCDRIVCSPHHGGKCEEATLRCIETVKSELRRAVRGEHLEYVVNPEALKYGEGLLNPELSNWQ